MTLPASPEQALARRARAEARRMWGAGWKLLTPQAQTHATYACAFVLLATSEAVPGVSSTCLASLRRLATEILDLSADPAR